MSIEKYEEELLEIKRVLEAEKQHVIELSIPIGIKRVIAYLYNTCLIDEVSLPNLEPKNYSFLAFSFKPFLLYKGCLDIPTFADLGVTEEQKERTTDFYIRLAQSCQLQFTKRGHEDIQYFQDEIKELSTQMYWISPLNIIVNYCGRVEELARSPLPSWLQERSEETEERLKQLFPGLTRISLELEYYKTKKGSLFLNRPYINVLDGLFWYVLLNLRRKILERALNDLPFGTSDLKDIQRFLADWSELVAIPEMHRLKERLRTLSLEELAYTRKEDLDKITKEATKILKRIVAIFWDFSSHDDDHCKEIIRKLEKFIPLEQKVKLHSYEAFLLLASVWLHDTGMAYDPNKGRIPTYDEIKAMSDDDRKNIRNIHADRSAKLIETKCHEFRLDKKEAQLVASICKCHRIDPITGKDPIYNLPEEYSLKRVKLRPKLLAALLRLADACDLSYERVSILLYELLNLTKPKDKKYWKGHIAIDDVDVDSKSWVITIYASPSSREGEQGLKFLEQKLRKDFESVKKILCEEVFHDERDMLLPYKEIKVTTL